ncbi:ABC transporter, permease [Formosa sp. Hel3_A1_48]|jgi:ABC-2 type transport system permease protein|nr:ABC transporter, permease [Formosa sp. Hel3_A1_48]
MTFLSPLFIVALLSLIAYLTSVNNEKVRTISVLDESGILSETLISSDQILYESLNGMDLEDAKTTSNSNKAYGLLHVPDLALEDVSEKIKFYSKESPSLSLISSLESKIEKRIGELKLKKMGVDLSKISASKTYVNINQEDFEGVKTSKAGSFLKLIFGAAAGYLLFMFIIIYGNLIMRSVIEEKSSRIIEVIISSVKPIQLMLGKIFGTSLAGITQFAIWVILIAILSFAASNFFGIDLSANPQQEMMTAAVSDVNANSELQALIAELHSLPLINLIVAFVLFFVGGYLLYSSLYAAIGAAVDNETDTQQFLMPVVILLVVGFYVGFFTALEDPHGTISVVFSYIPFTSPIVMLIRIPFGVPIWEQILSLSVLIFSFLVTVWIAAKIYRVGILMHGKKPSYKDLIKWLKY